ncbi:MAG: hypothetical protein ABGY11_10825 [Candidatus Thioglobus sp.]
MRGNLFNIGVVSSQVQGGGTSYMLDDFPNALGAFSLRKLSSTYTSSIIRLRRTTLGFMEEVNVDLDSNDEISMDSPVTAIVGVTLATTLGEFVFAPTYSNPDGLPGAASANIHTWYDQSGNGLDLIQLVGGRQPIVIKLGGFFYINSKPGVFFDGSDDTLWQDDVFGLEATATDIVHYSVQYIEDERFVLARGGHGGDYYGTGQYANTASGSYGSSPGTSPPNDWYVNGVALPKTLPAGGPFTDVDRDSVFYALSNFGGSVPPAAAGQTLITFTGINFISWSYPGPGLAEYELWSYGGGYNIKGKIQEFILYNAPNHPTQTDIETAINTYYTIYP